MHVNVEKTKIVVFRNNFKLSAQDQWFYNGMQIDVVKCFTYLGVYNGKFTRTQNVQASQGRKSMFHTLKICNENALNTETKLQVFDTYVSSVLNYCCEVWGFSAAKDVEKVHLEFCKRIMRIKNSTPSFIVFFQNWDDCL